MCFEWRKATEAALRGILFIELLNGLVFQGD
jgi:hypothetical protein